MEIGVGSGVVLAFVAANAEHIIGRPDVLAVGTDMNGFAAQAATETITTAIQDPDNTGSGVLGDVLLTDLAAALRKQSVDILIFNPPYVPTTESPGQIAQDVHEVTDQFEQDSRYLALAYAGGADGMETTNRLLETLPVILRQQLGVAYLLLCAQNRPQEVIDRIKSWGSQWHAVAVGSSGKQAGREKLQVLRIWEVSNDQP
jgi:release factor glutamine methyltransferase